MFVKELNAQQLDCLRWAMFYDDETDDILQEIKTPDDITDDMIFSHYDGVYFVEDDFS